MNKISIIVIAIFLSVCAAAQTPLNVMTFNLRYDTKNDSLNAWTYRKDHVAEEIKFYDVHLLGVQEALNHQMTELQERLPNFRSIGGGRDDGKEKGEYSAIFYDSTRLQLISTQMFWLSEKPNEVGVKGWDAAFPRMVTWGKFRDRKTKKIFFAFNTHFDHMGQVARRESAKLILRKAAEIAGSVPFIFTGDFNSKPSDEPIVVITDKSNPLHFTDSKEISKTGHYGPSGTFTGFRSKEVHDDPIDYIFLKGKFAVLKHATLSESWGGRFGSDHFAVLAVLTQN